MAVLTDGPNEPVLPPPPDTRDPKLNEWAKNLTDELKRYYSEVGLDRRQISSAINGDLYLPTPNVLQHTGNLNISLVDVIFTSVSFSTGAIIDDPAGVYVEHKLGRIPSGWFVAGLSSTFPAANSVSAGANHGVVITDQVMESRSGTHVGACPIDKTNYWNYAYVFDSTTIKGSTGGGSNGWAANGVKVGDEIRLYTFYDNTTGGTVAASGNSTTVTGTSTTFKTDFKPGWHFRTKSATTTDDSSWKLITSITSETVMDVYPAFGPNTSTAGASYEVLAFDLSQASDNLVSPWKVISAITAGTPEALTLETSTETPGNLYPYSQPGFSEANFTIRRPPDDTYAWLRCLTPSPTGAVVARIAFF